MKLTHRPKRYWTLKEARAAIAQSDVEADEHGMALLPGEVVIANVSLVGTVLGDTIQVRAPPADGSGAILYRAVDGYGTPFRTPRESDSPLTFGQMIRLLESLAVPPDHHYRELEEGETYLDQIRQQEHTEPETWLRVHGESDFYPELGVYFERQHRKAIRRWEKNEREMEVTREREERARAAKRAAALEPFASRIVDLIKRVLAANPRLAGHEQDVRSAMEDYVLDHGDWPAGRTRMWIRIGVSRNAYFDVDFDEPGTAV